MTPLLHRPRHALSLDNQRIASGRPASDTALWRGKQPLLGDFAADAIINRSGLGSAELAAADRNVGLWRPSGFISTRGTGSRLPASTTG